MADAAEPEYRRALRVAREQGATWLELRAARGYAQSPRSRDAPDEARELLEPVCAWFTEGKDTLDFLYAEGLLKTLA